MQYSTLAHSCYYDLSRSLVTVLLHVLERYTKFLVSILLCGDYVLRELDRLYLEYSPKRTELF